MLSKVYSKADYYVTRCLKECEVCKRDPCSFKDEMKVSMIDSILGVTKFEYFVFHLSCDLKINQKSSKLLNLHKMSIFSFLSYHFLSEMNFPNSKLFSLSFILTLQKNWQI